MLHCVAVCCSVLHLKTIAALRSLSCGSMLRYVAVSCGELQCVAVYCSMLQCVAVCCTSRQSLLSDPFRVTSSSNPPRILLAQRDSSDFLREDATSSSSSLFNCDHGKWEGVESARHTHTHAHTHAHTHTHTHTHAHTYTYTHTHKHTQRHNSR